MVNWRVHKFVALCVLGLIASGLLGIYPTNLNDMALFLQWKYILAIGTGYVAWAGYKMLHF